MLQRTLVLAASVGAAALLTACATADDPGNPVERRLPPEVRTGSNIPVRDKAPPLTEDQRLRQAEELRRAQQNQSTGQSGRPGS